VDVHELTAAYALDALDAHEREDYEAHLAQCESCRAELAGLSGAAAALAYASPAPAPPPELRARILDAAAAERQNVTPLPARSRWVLRATVAAAAVAACAAVGFGVWAVSLSRSLDSARSAHAADERAMQIYLDPHASRSSLRGQDGAVAVDQTGQAVLLVHKLPAAPSGKVYEAWVIPPGSKPIRAGVFDGGSPMTMVRLGTMVPSGSVVAATVERDGGVEAPTSQPVFSAST
jgi:anti-sigma-K factor RskA